jgi:hypothetical protein
MGDVRFSVEVSGRLGLQLPCFAPVDLAWYAFRSKVGVAGSGFRVRI